MSKVLFWVADWSLSRSEAVARLGGNVEEMADAIGLNCRVLLSSSVRKVAGYVTGSREIAWAPGDWEAFDTKKFSHVTIDQAPDAVWRGGAVKDCEQFAATPALGARWAHEAIQHGLIPTLYFSASWLESMNAALSSLGLPHGEIVAYQWASPSSNPNSELPGTRLTLKEANVDLSVTAPLWYPTPKPTPVNPLTHDQQVFNWAYNLGYNAGWKAAKG